MLMVDLLVCILRANRKELVNHTDNHCEYLFTGLFLRRPVDSILEAVLTVSPNKQ